MTSAASFGGMMVSFSKRMGWWDLEVLLSNAVQRLGFGVKTDILPLVEIKGVKAARARALWNAGYRSVRAVASAKVLLSLRALHTLYTRSPFFAI
jgi:replicative superfamily II helicase